MICGLNIADGEPFDSQAIAMKNRSFLLSLLFVNPTRNVIINLIIIDANIITKAIHNIDGDT